MTSKNYFNLSFVVLITISVCSIADANAKSFQTAVFPLEGKGVSQNIKRRINKKLAKAFSSMGEVKVVSEGKVSKALKGKPCRNSLCIVKKGKEVGAVRVVTGNITVKKKNLKRRKGTEGADQYLVRVSEVEIVLVSVEIWDIEKGRFLKRFSVQSEQGGIDRAVKRMSSRIEAFYEKEHQNKINRANAEIVKGSHKVFFGFSPSSIIPLKYFRNMADPGAGLSLHLGMCNLLFDNSIFMISGGFWYLPEKGDLKSFYTGQASFMAGYNFSLSRNFSIIPSAGAGYHFHISEKVGQNVYFDPMVTFRCEISWKFSRDYMLTLGPAYGLFFEEEKNGMYLLVEAGVRMKF